jgi:hypothetical protein
MARKEGDNWERVGLGTALAATAGAAFGHAWSVVDREWWWVGAMTALAGALAVLAAHHGQPEPPRKRKAPPRPAPYLGELLLEKKWINEFQLGNALVRQHYTKRPLGQILVEMQAITPAQLAEALEEQKKLGALRVARPREKE